MLHLSNMRLASMETSGTRRANANKPVFLIEVERHDGVDPCFASET